MLSLAFGKLLAPGLADREPVVKAVATLGFAIGLLGLMNLVWSITPRSISLMLDKQSIAILGMRITGTRLLAIGAGIAITVLTGARRCNMGMSGSTLDQPILVDRSGGVVTVHLNRPSHFNALSESLMKALQCELDKIAADPVARCVVIAGTGKDFSADHDLREIRSNRTLAFYVNLFATCSRLMLTIQSIPVPVIARVQGIATAAGCHWSQLATWQLLPKKRGSRFPVSMWGPFVLRQRWLCREMFPPSAHLIC